MNIIAIIAMNCPPKLDGKSLLTYIPKFVICRTHAPLCDPYAHVIIEANCIF